MTRRLHSVFLFAAIATTCCSISAFACGDKATSASKTPAGKSAVVASSGACSAEMAAKCTPEMAAACKAGGGSMTSCPAHGKTKTTAASAASADHCAKPGNAKAAAASADCCAMKGAKTAVATGSGSSAHKGSSVDAVVTGGQSCGTKGTMAGHDCDACSDMAMCESELKSAGSQFQVVPLKNGVMYVYTATDAKNVRTVQSAVSRRTQRMNALVNANTAKLCPDCKTMRGAMASGKLTREIVNIEGGSISLVTSSDPSMVARLYTMAGLSQQKLVKS